MKAAGGQGCIGVTTGQLLCACVGSRIRAEYTVFGDSINLSARLMCKATAGMGDILCDYSTQHMATSAAAYTRLEPLVVGLSTTFVRQDLSLACWADVAVLHVQIRPVT